MQQVTLQAVALSTYALPTSQPSAVVPVTTSASACAILGSCSRPLSRWKALLHAGTSASFLLWTLPQGKGEHPCHTPPTSVWTPFGQLHADTSASFLLRTPQGKGVLSLMTVPSGCCLVLACTLQQASVYLHPGAGNIAVAGTAQQKKEFSSGNSSFCITGHRASCLLGLTGFQNVALCCRSV